MGIQYLGFGARGLGSAVYALGCSGLGFGDFGLIYGLGFTM